MATIFTGQRIIGQDTHDPKRQYDIVACACCRGPVSLRVAYIDPYVNTGEELYVHYRCLSPQRKRQVDELTKDHS